MASAKTEETTATAVEAAPKERFIKNGGAKGALIVSLLVSNPELTRSQLAEAAQATNGRVGEVIRHMAQRGTTEEQAIVAKHVAAQIPREPKAPKAKATKESTTKDVLASPKPKSATARKAAATKADAAVAAA